MAWLTRKLPHVSPPVDAVVAVTYLCNSRCTMCDFWKETRKPELAIADFAKLPRTLRDINISGGEPFLHPQIVEIVRTLRAACPKAQITISTNGFLTDLIVKRVAAIRGFYPDIAVRISVDGVGDKHEEIRRIPQAFAKDLATLRALRTLGVRNLGLAYTMTNDNIDHLVQVERVARAEGVQFTYALMHTSEFYFGAKENVRDGGRIAAIAGEFDALAARELASWNPKRWARAFFAHGLAMLAAHGVQALPSRAGTDFFFLDPFGNIMPSVMHPNIMGNIREYPTFGALWNSDRAHTARTAATHSPQPYWLICTARTAIKRHPFRVIGWVCWRKLGTMFVGISKHTYGFARA